MKRIEIVPLTPDRWRDFTCLFGRNGACAGCWCMWWRLSAGEWRKNRGARNRRAHLRLLKEQGPTGLLAYVDGEPAGWCAVAPRTEYPRLATSRVLKAVDDQPVWSVTCFFVAKHHRHQGLTVVLLKAARSFVKRQGGSLMEGYPVEPMKPQADVFVFTGLASAFRKAGFKEVARRSPSRPIMRRRA
jgi:GNAT superfamily N-acetyltransferase